MSAPQFALGAGARIRRGDRVANMIVVRTVKDPAATAFLSGAVPIRI